MIIPNSFPITKVNVTSTQQENPPYAMVFATNINNSFEWGAECDSGKVTAVANFPILQSGGTLKDISYLQICCSSGQYQVFWEIAGEGPGVSIMLQQVGYTGSYLKSMTNITPEGGLSIGDGFINLQLNIDMNPASGQTGISLTKA